MPTPCHGLGVIRGLVPAALALSLAVAGTARAAEVQVHGVLDVVAAERGDAYTTNRLTRGDANFDAYGARLFVNAQVNPRIQVFTQVTLRDASNMYVDGAYVMVTPSAAHDLHVLAGKIPWPLGTYAPRTYSSKNPLIGTPLMYQYHSSLLWYEVVPSTDALIAASGTGQTGVNYFGYAEGLGMPIVDDSYWDVGVTLVGAQRPFEYALGMTAGTPGWGSTGEDGNAGKTVLGRIGVMPIPAVRLGISGAYGPYLESFLKPSLPPGAAVEDYHQKLAMADLEVQMGLIELRGEAAHNTWESPFVGDLKVGSGYGELKVKLPVGAFVAGRFDVLRFAKVTDSLGGRHPWDTNVTRLESGFGYRFDRDVVAKLVYQQTTLEHDTAPHERLGLYAAQLSVAF